MRAPRRNHDKSFGPVILRGGVVHFFAKPYHQGSLEDQDVLGPHVKMYLRLAAVLAHVRGIAESKRRESRGRDRVANEIHALDSIAPGLPGGVRTREKQRWGIAPGAGG